jgi:hypothetical protein
MDRFRGLADDYVTTKLHLQSPKSIVAQEPRAVELAEQIAVKAPGPSGKIYGNLFWVDLILTRGV